jgi:Xaa-Pro aminopeptidase
MLETPTFSARRARVASALGLERELLVIGAGRPVPLPENTDQCYPFRTHSEYLYLAGTDCPGGVLGFDPLDGPADGWVSFVPGVTEAERVWEGRRQPPGRLITGLESWLATRGGRAIAALGEPVRGVAGDPDATKSARDALLHARRPKDAEEIALLRRAAGATAAGYATVAPLIVPGASERALQIEIEAAFFRAGGTTTGYGTIVATGPNAAVLHFNPTARTAGEGEFVLVDAGAEIDRYVCDVTRTYIAGTPTPFQRDLHQLVLEAEERAIARCINGAEWRDIHFAAAVDLTAGLVAMGIMRGDPQSLVEQTAHLLFFPHGIGHMVGLGVRDASGLAPGRKRPTEPALKNLRSNMPLLPGYVMTVEPGIYFIPAILEDPARREKHRDAVAWSRVGELLPIGGVRIEDNVLITESGPPENLTAAIPKALQ